MTAYGARPQVLLLFTIVFGCVGLGSSPAAPAEVSAGQRQEVIPARAIEAPISFRKLRREVGSSISSA